jgi:hypothetical protein
LHASHLNEQIVQVLKTIGFDKRYQRGVGQYLYDERGEGISTCSVDGAYSPLAAITRRFAMLSRVCSIASYRTFCRWACPRSPVFWPNDC